jgi:hypothetical protein
MERRRRRVTTTWRLTVAVGLALALGIGAWINTSTLAKEEGTGSSSRSSRASKASDGGKTEEKLNEILENQQKILKRLDEVMEELKIVKIRASVR